MQAALGSGSDGTDALGLSRLAQSQGRRPEGDRLGGEAASRQQYAVRAEAPEERILLLEKVCWQPARVSRTPRGKRREP